VYEEGPLYISASNSSKWCTFVVESYRTGAPRTCQLRPTDGRRWTSFAALWARRREVERPPSESSSSSTISSFFPGEDGGVEQEGEANRKRGLRERSSLHHKFRIQPERNGSSVRHPAKAASKYSNEGGETRRKQMIGSEARSLWLRDNNTCINLIELCNTGPDAARASSHILASG
jgi:hypothetical protein